MLPEPSDPEIGGSSPKCSPQCATRTRLPAPQYPLCPSKRLTPHFLGQSSQCLSAAVNRSIAIIIYQLLLCFLVQLGGELSNRWVDASCQFIFKMETEACRGPGYAGVPCGTSSKKGPTAQRRYTLEDELASLRRQKFFDQKVYEFFPHLFP